ncbi:hypothetical protein P0Y43_05080 [Pseudomonas entomophila]|uniref:hypothetical protein n=1 Tax=Pseudomonas entomophila TaxID=312306 RepID=UPI0023D7DF8F|nr:hypothetical protein [Pseudomonas entomophila]MDF0730102.1 hypothetical protein [Pseudomonas entomophila]
MRDSRQGTSHARFIRETRGEATTTVIAVTSCPATLDLLHHEFRYFDDVCILHLDALGEHTTRLDFPEHCRPEQLQAPRCFLLLDEPQRISTLAKLWPTHALPCAQPLEQPAQALLHTVDRIKQTTRDQRRRLQA